MEVSTHITAKDLSGYTICELSRIVSEAEPDIVEKLSNDLPQCQTDTEFRKRHFDQDPELVEAIIQLF